MALPADLKRFLRVNNGAADFDAAGTYCRGAAFMPGGHRMLSLAEIAEQSRSLNEIVARHGGDMIGYWWHPQWVLFARHIAADGLAIDQRPGPGQGAVAVRATVASLIAARFAGRLTMPSVTTAQDAALVRL